MRPGELILRHRYHVVVVVVSRFTIHQFLVHPGRVCFLAYRLLFLLARTIGLEKLARVRGGWDYRILRVSHKEGASGERYDGEAVWAGRSLLTRAFLSHTCWWGKQKKAVVHK